MSDMAKQTTPQQPFFNPTQAESLQFKYDFALTCAAEARTFPVGSPKYQENMGYAKEKRQNLAYAMFC